MPDSTDAPVLPATTLVDAVAASAPATNAQQAAQAAPTQPAVKTFTQEEVNRLLGERAQRAADGARAQFLGTFKDYGVQSADDLAALVKTAHDVKQAQMTELQRAQERTKQLEADLARATAEAAARAEDVRRSRIFRENQVAPEYEEVLSVLLDRAKTDTPSNFDERAWLESIKQARPVLFAGGVLPNTPQAPAVAPPTPIGATTGVVFPQPPAVTATPTPAFDARRASVDDLRQWEAQMGISVPSGGRV
jgi:hypothetical protein